MFWPWLRIYTSDYGKGRLSLRRYPNSVSASSQTSAGSNSSRFTVRHEYNAGGYLASVRDESSGTVYWTGVAASAAGAITRENLGNGLTTLQTIDRATGALETLTTGPGVLATVQNLEFDWDRAGNLTVRRGLQADKREEFDYDGLYRPS